jgi:hypothetical protein
MCFGKAKSLSWSKVHESSSGSLGKAPDGLANNKLGWKGLPGTNTLAYRKHSYIADVIGCIALGPVVYGIRLSCH